MNTLSISEFLGDDKFSWNDFVAVRRVDAIAVYDNGEGEVVIRQQGHNGSKDSFIAIPFDRIEPLISALTAMNFQPCADDPKSDFGGDR